MTITINMGIPGFDEIRPGTHMCALYSGPAERDRLLFPFLREGIREGDKCLCLIDDAEVASSVRDRVEGQPGGDQPPRSEQLDVNRTSDAYLESGRFSAVFMCMYDLDRFGISMLVDVLKTHLKVLLDGMVLDNRHYLTPTEYLAAETSFVLRGAGPEVHRAETKPGDSKAGAAQIGEVHSGSLSPSQRGP